MTESRIAFWAFVIIGYAISRSLNPSYRDQVAFLILFVFYIIFLANKKFLIKQRLGRGDIVIGIPVIYGLIISALQYYEHIKEGSIVVWIVFVLLAIISAGYRIICNKAKLQ